MRAAADRNSHEDAISWGRGGRLWWRQPQRCNQLGQERPLVMTTATKM